MLPCSTFSLLVLPALVVSLAEGGGGRGASLEVHDKDGRDQLAEAPPLLFQRPAVLRIIDDEFTPLSADTILIPLTIDKAAKRAGGRAAALKRGGGRPAKILDDDIIEKRPALYQGRFKRGGARRSQIQTEIDYER